MIFHLAEKSVSNMLFTQIIKPLINQKLKNLNRKLNKILKLCQIKHSIIYNYYFTEIIQKIKKKRYEKEIIYRLRKFLSYKNDATI